MIETYITPAILAALILSAEVDAQSGIRPVWIAGPPEEVKKLRGVVEVVEGTVVQGYLEIPPWSTRNPEYGFTAHFINKTNAILGRIQIKIAFVDSTGEVIYTQSGHPDWIQPDEGPEWDPGENRIVQHEIRPPEFLECGAGSPEKCRLPSLHLLPGGPLLRPHFGGEGFMGEGLNASSVESVPQGLQVRALLSHGDFGIAGIRIGPPAIPEGETVLPGVLGSRGIKAG